MDWGRMANVDWDHMIYTVLPRLEPIVYGFLLLVCVVARWGSGSRAAVWLGLSAGLSLCGSLVLGRWETLPPLQTEVAIHTVCRFGGSLALLCGGVRLTSEQRRAAAEAVRDGGTVRQVARAPHPLLPMPHGLGLVTLHVLAWILGAVGAGFLVAGAVVHYRRTQAFHDVLLGCAAACYGVALFLTAMADVDYAALRYWVPLPYRVFDSMSELGVLWPWLMLLAGLLALVGGGGLLAALLRPGPAQQT